MCQGGGFFYGSVKDYAYPIDIQAKYFVPNLTSTEQHNLRIIQTVDGDISSNPKLKDVGQLDLYNDGSMQTAFVDGGKCSLKQRMEPWYANDDIAPYRSMHRIYSPTGITFTISDKVGAVESYTVLNFESYVTIQNYNNSNKFTILGVVKWGFTRKNAVVTPSVIPPQMLGAKSFSTKAQQIWDYEYGNEYKKY